MRSYARRNGFYLQERSPIETELQFNRLFSKCTDLLAPLGLPFLSRPSVCKFSTMSTESPSNRFCLVRDDVAIRELGGVDIPRLEVEYPFR